MGEHILQEEISYRNTRLSKICFIVKHVFTEDMSFGWEGEGTRLTG